jgi:hypothetical protein
MATAKAALHHRRSGKVCQARLEREPWRDYGSRLTIFDVATARGRVRGQRVIFDSSRRTEAAPSGAHWQNCKANIRSRLNWADLVEAGIDLACIALEDLCLVVGGEPRYGVDVTLGVIEIVARLGIDAFDRADHL